MFPHILEYAPLHYYVNPDFSNWLLLMLFMQNSSGYRGTLGLELDYEMEHRRLFSHKL